MSKVNVQTEQNGLFKSGGYTAVVTDGFTRPANTTQYTANDVVSNSTTETRMLHFKNIARTSGGSGIIHSALMFVSTDAATNPNFDLILFDTPNITRAADNAASTVTDGELIDIAAAITFDGTDTTNIATVGANLVVKVATVGQVFKCRDGYQDLWGLVIDRGAYTPASAERFDFKLFILQD